MFVTMFLDPLKAVAASPKRLIDFIFPGNIVLAMVRFTWRERLQAATALANLIFLYWDWIEKTGPPERVSVYPEHPYIMTAHYALLAFANMRILHTLLELPHRVHDKLALWLLLYWVSVVATNILHLHIGPAMPAIPGYPPTWLCEKLYLRRMPCVITCISSFILTRGGIVQFGMPRQDRLPRAADDLLNM